MSGAPQAVRARLLALRDEKNAPFMAKLVPTLLPENVLGVRMPDCRSLARELCKELDIGLFLADLPHRYLDENNLHALLLNEEKDYTAVLRRYSVKEIWTYGIAFWDKECRVVMK